MLRVKPKIKLKPKEAVKKAVETKHVNLREIIDWSHQFQMIYSGVENDVYFDLLYGMGIRDFLMSHYYITKKRISLHKRFEGKEATRLFIDSGAYTYMSDIEFKDVTVPEWEKKLVGYLEWAKRNKEYLFAIANFDFELIVGATVVAEWNKKYFEPFMLETGIPVCFVHHGASSYHPWEYYCKRYPYVGFSSVSDGESLDLDEYHSRLKTAEKYDAVVHGFGMTKTSLLTELPFYTSDSTTWLVGLQYGEINYWTGNKMTRLKKEKWKGEYLDTVVNKYALNRTKLLEEDTSELIKANIHAFMDAQEYINQRLISRMYWLKARAVKRDLNNLPEDFFPPALWVDSAPSNRAGYKEYAAKMNINPEYEGAEDLVCDVTAFLNWENPEYSGMKEYYLRDENVSIIEVNHEVYINRIVGSQEEKIQDLIAFFGSCVSGESDKLLHLGTNFDRVVKERDSYIEDDEDELVDISKEEVLSRMKQFMPTTKMLTDGETEEKGAPEIDELDEEIYAKAEIIPTFDENGKFLKGQVAVRKPKKMYSDKYPKVACDTCRAAAKCPEFKAGHVCAYNKMFQRYDTRDMVDIIQAMQGMVGHNLARMQKSMLIETITGETSVEVTNYINQNMSLLDGLRRMYETGSDEVLSQTRIYRSDGTSEETTKITNPKDGGILAKIFGNLSKDDRKPAEFKEEELITVESTVNTPETEEKPAKESRYSTTEEYD